MMNLLLAIFAVTKDGVTVDIPEVAANNTTLQNIFNVALAGAGALCASGLRGCASELLADSALGLVRGGGSAITSAGLTGGASGPGAGVE